MKTKNQIIYRMKSLDQIHTFSTYFRSIIFSFILQPTPIKELSLLTVLELGKNVLYFLQVKNEPM